MYNLPGKGLVGAGRIEFDLSKLPDPVAEGVARLASRGHSIGMPGRGSRIDDGARVDFDYNRDDDQINYSTVNWWGGTREFGTEVQECFDEAGVEVRQRNNGSNGVDIVDERFRNDTVDYEE